MTIFFRVLAIGPNDVGAAHVKTFGDDKSATAYKEQLITEKKYRREDIKIEAVNEDGSPAKT